MSTTPQARSTQAPALRKVVLKPARRPTVGARSSHRRRGQKVARVFR